MYRIHILCYNASYVTLIFYKLIIKQKMLYEKQNWYDSVMMDVCEIVEY